MNKSDFTKKVASKMRVSIDDAALAVNSVLDSLSEAIAEEDGVAIVGFGTFGVKERAERVGVNPATGEKIKIAASKAPYFKPGKILKDACNKKK